MRGPARHLGARATLTGAHSSLYPSDWNRQAAKIARTRSSALCALAVQTSRVPLVNPESQRLEIDADEPVVAGTREAILDDQELRIAQRQHAVRTRQDRRGDAALA